MDAVQQFVAQLKIAVPETFVIGGASKVNLLSLMKLNHECENLCFCSMDGQVSCRLMLYVLHLIFFLIHLAWTAAAVDNQRVIAAIPIVMNTINFQIVSTR